MRRAEDLVASIQSVYIALFGRPADPSGLAFWTNATNGGQDLSFLIGRLTASPEYATRFTSQSNTQIIISIYVSVFGREPDAAGARCLVPAFGGLDRD